MYILIINKKWRVSDSNTQPSALEADALPLRQPSLAEFFDKNVLNNAFLIKSTIYF